MCAKKFHAVIQCYYAIISTIYYRNCVLRLKAIIQYAVNQYRLYVLQMTKIYMLVTTQHKYKHGIIKITINYQDIWCYKFSIFFLCQESTGYSTKLICTTLFHKPHEITEATLTHIIQHQLHTTQLRSNILLHSHTKATQLLRQNKYSPKATRQKVCTVLNVTSHIQLQKSHV